MKTIFADKNVVKKVASKEGKTIQIGNARLTWKAMGVDTAYGTSLYEMDLAPGVGIPVHSHPYAEVSYGAIPCCYRVSSTRGKVRGVTLEEPAAVILHGGVCEGGEPMPSW